MPRETDAAKPAVFDDWLSVSTDGFAAMNAGRDPAHLTKELVQNALDALNGRGGKIILTAEAAAVPRMILINCTDDGCGMGNLADIRTVFYTSKTDSHLQRGRMGRGFKEMLCLCDSADVTSGSHRIEFRRDSSGKRFTRLCTSRSAQPVTGTEVSMMMPWDVSVIPVLEAYFQRLLVPQGIELVVNGCTIEPRQPSHGVGAKLPTEIFDNGRWIRPLRPTIVELVKIAAGEEPTVYELGIPVCPVQYDVPYHANVLQRVPMNPCRDAVASGYLTRLHRACLPTLLPELSSEQVRQDWVGNVAPHCPDEIQQQIITKGFGDNIARSVPKMGARQFDEDARDIGVDVIDTKQTSGGFRQILQDHVPTTRDFVVQHNRKLTATAVAGGFAIADAFSTADQASAQKRRLIEAVGGKERVETVMDFARWFCQRLLDGYQEPAVCSVTLSLLNSAGAVATWSANDVLTLGVDTPWLWTDPLGEESLGVYIHESVHLCGAISYVAQAAFCAQPTLLRRRYSSHNGGWQCASCVRSAMPVQARSRHGAFSDLSGWPNGRGTKAVPPTPRGGRVP
jgi:hypothetical protein